LGNEIIESLKVINDTAKRGVKLMEEFNEKLTKNEHQKQFVLQVPITYILFLKIFNKHSIKKCNYNYVIF
jgi:hypothetical protein